MQTPNVVLGTETSSAAFVARAVRVCNYFEVMGSPGHCSVRDPDDANVLWINNRHAGRSILTAADVVPYDIRAGRRIGAGVEPPSEHYIHRELYLRFPQIAGIVHSHPENILALSCAGHALKPLIASGAFLPEGGAPVFDSPVLINTEVRSRGMADAMGDAPIVVMRQHGTVTVGRTLEEAVTRMVRAEMNAKTQLRTAGVGTPLFLHGAEKAGLNAEGGDGLHGVKKFWTYLEETADRNGAFLGLE
jgi:ribulose-5-phosphate 4-epimerase/fuculose-1-phosphate aldolase